MFIYLNLLPLDLFIGIYPEEELRKQRIFLNLKLEGPFLKAAEASQLSMTIDYAQLENQLLAEFNGTRYKLLESLAKNILQYLFSHYEIIDSIYLELQKPKAMKIANNVSVIVEMQRNEFSKL